MRRALFICLILCLSALAPKAQDRESNSFLVGLIEDSLSSDSRQIRLNGIEGLLASDARVAEITVADREGIWLTIRGADIVWTRSALLSGRLKIDSMRAESIEIARLPQAEPAPPTLEAEPFSLPELPVSVEIGALDVPRLSLGETVLGQSAELSLSGALSLIGGALDTDIALERTDAEGRFALKASFENADRRLDVDLDFSEPAGGIVAGLLKIEGRPALSMTVTGSGPLDNIDLVLNAQTGGSDALSGQLSLRDEDGGIRFDGRLNGALSPLIAPSYAAFFAGESTLSALGVVRSSGGLTLDAFALKTGALSLEGEARTTDDGFLSRAVLTGKLGQENTRTVLPFGQDISIAGLDLDVSYGEDPSGLWQARLTGTDLRIAEIAAQRLNLTFQGTVDGINNPEARALTVNAVGDLDQLSAADDDLSRALGQRISFQLASDWRPGRFEIQRARIGGAAARIELIGAIAEFGFDGEVAARIARLAPFGGALGRDLQGSMDLSLNGQIKPLLGSFDLTMDGTSEALKLDVPALDPLLTGTTRLSGRILRNETGFRTQNVALSNQQVRITSDGILASDRADLDFEAALTDLAVLTNRASGRAVFTGRAEGTDGIINISTRIGIDEGQLLDRPLERLAARFLGVFQGGDLSGRIDGTGQLDAAPLTIGADLALRPNTQSLQNLTFGIGPARLSGALTRRSDGLMRGALDLDAPDITLLAALFLQEATGAASARLRLEPGALGQEIEATGRLGDITYGDVTIATADLDLTVQNALGIPTLAGRLALSNASAAGVTIESGLISAGGRDGRTDFTARLDLTNATDANAVGALITTAEGFDLELSRLAVDRGTPVLRLLDAARIRFAGARIDLDQLGFSVGDGTIRATGEINGGYDVALALEDVDLAVANAFREDLGLAGAVSGTLDLGGPRDAPDLNFDLEARAVSAAALRSAQIPPVNLSASGQTTADEVQLQATLSGPDRLDSTLEGTVALSDLDMKLAGRLNAFPLALIDAAAGRTGLRGNATGTFNLLGTPAKPRVNFQLSGTDLSVRAMRDNAIAPLTLSAEGSFVNNVITLPQARITGARNMNFTISGRIPLALDGLDAAASGTVPLSVMDVALARSGLAATGTGNLSLRATGRLSAPNLQGSFNLAGGTFVSSTANFRLEDVTLDAGFRGNRLEITEARARNSRGGTIEASGGITIDTRAGFPINLTTRLRDLRYTDGRLATALASGNLQMSGALMGQSLISGDVTVEELEFSLLQQLGTRKSYSLDVRHVNMTPEVRATLERAGYFAQEERTPGPDSDINFDISLDAPNRVFVRGRGVDAELGGRLRLEGNTRNLKPAGQFNLLRGRINILAQRIELDEGFIRFNGSLDPELYLRARTVSEDVEANVTLEGPASKPILSFSSVPDLPDDEILARIVFDRSLSDLSPLQVAQLATAAGELSGRTGPSFFSQLRDATGLDDLDFETDNQGTTTVRIGKYIQDNIYSSIEADNRGSSRATINLDINRDFTAKGTLDNAGNTSFGIFFEKDY